MRCKRASLVMVTWVHVYTRIATATSISRLCTAVGAVTLLIQKEELVTCILHSADPRVWPLHPRLVTIQWRSVDRTEKAVLKATTTCKRTPRHRHHRSTMEEVYFGIRRKTSQQICLLFHSHSRGIEWTRQSNLNLCNLILLVGKT